MLTDSRLYGKREFQVVIQMSKTEPKTTVEWKDIPWRKVEKIVFKLQKRIFQASQREDSRAVSRLQKTLMNSWSAKVLAVRRVTQENQGKKTAGVDGIKSLTPIQRLELVDQLSVSRKAKPVRRVFIDKPGRNEKRPLGIPTMNDRAVQALVKAALEPEWEAKFEPNSYGFRPGRSCHDAIEAIFVAINQKPKFVLDADIAKCFDKINHDALLKKLNTSPTIRRQIRAWLKAGVMDWSGNPNHAEKGVTNPTFEGTPQGGVISPLLANIALHGMEYRIKQVFPRLSNLARETWFHKKGTEFSSPDVIRYADDFVILHENQAVVQKCKQIIADWLNDIGLELKPEKTKLSHTLKPTEEGNVGFDFLGLTIRQFEVGRHASKQGFKTIITPSKKALKAHTANIGKIIERHKDAPKEALIANLNPVIRGWSNYYKTQCSKEAFKKADHITFMQLRGWAVHRHRNMGEVRAEWKANGTRQWVFMTNQGHALIEHADTKITRHTKVRDTKSPYDGDWKYWSTRKGSYLGIPERVAKVLKRQKGKCLHCGLYLASDDLVEIHHNDGNPSNNKHGNLTAVHKYCHDTIHAMWESKAWEMRSDEPYSPTPNPNGN